MGQFHGITLYYQVTGLKFTKLALAEMEKVHGVVDPGEVLHLESNYSDQTKIYS